MKIVLVGLLVLIIGFLFAGLYFMYKDKGRSKRVLRMLTIRVALSVCAFLIVIGGFIFGWFPRT